MNLLRNLWLYAVSLVLTVFYAGRITMLSYVRPSKLDDFCDEAPRVWSRGILKTAGVEVELEGAGHIDPDRPQIVVANHASWFDVFALSACFPGTYHYVAKEELSRIPVFGRSWICCGHIAIDRADRGSAVASLDRAAEKIRRDNATIIMFPEGTRSPDGELQRFKKGAFVLAIKSDVEIVPAAIIGSHEVMPKGQWRVRPGRIRIRMGRPIPVRGLEMRDRNELVRKARAQVADLLQGREDPGAPGIRSVRGGTGSVGPDRSTGDEKATGPDGSGATPSHDGEA